MLAAPLLTKFPADVPGKAARGGPRSWSLCGFDVPIKKLIKKILFDVLKPPSATSKYPLLQDYITSTEISSLRLFPLV